MSKAAHLLGIVAAISLLPAAAHARKPEDVFSGQIVITKTRLKAHYPSGDAFIGAVRAARTDKVWPKEQEGNDHAVWKLEYIAFFARPLGDYEVTVKFWDVTGGAKRYVAGDAQMTRDQDSRILASDIELAKPVFNVNKKYLMSVESRGRKIATTTFWLRGKQDSFSGTVEFSEDEARGRGTEDGAPVTQRKKN